MQRIKAFFDSRATWTFFGMLAGSLFGGDVSTAVGAIGNVVMAVL